MTAEPVLATRTASAVIRHARPDFGLLYLVPEGALPPGRRPRLETAGRLIRRMLSGRRVGGRVSLSEVELRFVPSALNRLLDADDGTVAIPLDEVTRVGFRAGWLTGAVDVETARGSLAFRCRRAEAFARQIRAAAAGARRPLAAELA